MGRVTQTRDHDMEGDGCVCIAYTLNITYRLFVLFVGGERSELDFDNWSWRKEAKAEMWIFKSFQLIK